MHALFAVTASHLQHLQPHDQTHQAAVSEHLSQALPGLRTALDMPFITGAGDALMACSMLLLQNLWGSPIQTVNADFTSWDSLLGLYRGVKDIVFTFWELKHGSRFTPWLVYSPSTSIAKYLVTQPADPEIEACFSHCLTCTQITADTETDLEECEYAVRGLIAIWRALKMGIPALEASSIYLDVARYLFTLPITLPIINPDGFGNRANMKNARYQTILLYYFAAIIKFKSARFWWMQSRARLMFEWLLVNLRDKCDVCTGMARVLIDEED